MKKVVGVYTSSREIIQKEWKPIEYLKQEIGLNLIILGMGPAGDKWRPSEKVLAKAPFELNIPPDSDDLEDFLREAHKRDIDVWICIALYAEMDQGPNHPDLMFRDFEGRIVEPVSKYGTGWAWSWCPSNRRLREYYEALLYDLARKYDIDGFTLTHQRYSPIGHSIFNLFGCGCPECERAASQLGYDFKAIRNSMMSFLGRLKKLSQGVILKAAELELGFLDLFYHLGADSRILDWINLRCDLIRSGMERYYRSAKDAREDVTIGSDNFPPSFSLIAGHKYRDFEENADFLSPLLSHVMIFTIFNFIEFTARMVEWNHEFPEDQFLSLLYQAFGYDKIRLPVKIKELLEHPKLPHSDFSDTKIPLSEIVRNEILKAKSFTSGRKPMYGVFAAHSKLNEADVEKRALAMKEADLEGFILQVGQLPGSRDNIAAIRRVFS